MFFHIDETSISTNTEEMNHLRNVYSRRCYLMTLRVGFLLFAYICIVVGIANYQKDMMPIPLTGLNLPDFCLACSKLGFGFPTPYVVVISGVQYFICHN